MSFVRVVPLRVGDGDRTIAFMCLTRPRSARPFSVDDVLPLDRLRPWLAHAFRQSPLGDVRSEVQDPLRTQAAPVLSGQNCGG
jgi:hypothetical protein